MAPFMLGCFFNSSLDSCTVVLCQMPMAANLLCIKLLLLTLSLALHDLVLLVWGYTSVMLNLNVYSTHRSDIRLT